MADDLIKALEVFDRGPGKVTAADWVGLQQQGWVSVTGGLTDAGRLARL